MSDTCGWDEIHAWVNAHRGMLPQTLVELSRYPMSYRRAIFVASRPDIQAALWREHWESFIGPGSSLSTEQQEFLRGAIAELPDTIADAQRRHGLESRVAAMFSREEAGLIFATLGPLEPPGGLSRPEP